MFGTLKVTYQDGSSVEGKTIEADAVRFERQFKMPASRFFGRDESGEIEIYLEHLWYFGWLVARREGEELPYDDAWLDKVKAVEIVKVAEPVPTDPSPSPSL